MVSSTVFTDKDSQVVALPKAVAFPDSVHQIEILKIGRGRVIVPKGARWDDFFEFGPSARENFFPERDQLTAESREPL